MDTKRGQKTWENQGKTRGKWEHHRKMSGKPIGKWGNHGNMGNMWEKRGEEKKKNMGETLRTSLGGWEDIGRFWR